MTSHLVGEDLHLSFTGLGCHSRARLITSCLLSSQPASHLLRVPLHDAAVKGGSHHHGEVRVP